jgi:hypothetical protein
MAGRPSKYQGLVDTVLDLDGDEEELRDRPSLKLTQTRQDAMAHWSEDPWNLLSGKDPDTGKPLIWTIDQRDKKTPRKPFPAHLDYLHYLVDLLEGEQYLQIEKCSQMIVTTTIALWAMCRTLTKPMHKSLLSKHKEDEAVTILREKIMEPWEHFPEWLKFHWPLRNKPSNRVECKATKSHVLGLPENAAAADARGQTYQVAMIDEAEWQEQLPALLGAMLPRAAQVIFWSTPAMGGPGVTTFKQYLADNGIKKIPRLVELKQKYAHVRGMSTRRNEDRNVTICKIEHTADPEKRSEKWLNETAAPFGGRQSSAFKREILIDRTTNVGRNFYPQFVESPRRYLLRCNLLPKNEPIVRGWDFGGNNPATIWATWSKRSKRFWVLRELQGHDIDTFQFRDLVKYLSGQLSLEGLAGHPRALQMLEELKFNKAYYNPEKQHFFPWFEGKHKFLDFAGNEGVMGGRGLQRKEEAKTAAEILGQGDIILYSRQTLHSKRTEVINGLSRMRQDGWPGLLIDPACSILWDGLTGGLVYAKATAQNPDPSEVAPDSVFSHLHDCLGYAACNMVELEDADHLRVSIGADGQIIMPPGPDMQLQSYLMEARW